MATVVLVAGPPFCSAMWAAVSDRLKHHGHDVLSWDLVGPVEGGGGLVDRLHALATALEDVPDGAVVVAHGLAVPVVLRLPALERLGGLVLSNGPIDRLDAATAALARACARPGLAARTWLHPALFQRWLWSSLGLRRLVVNPYVMGRDTVVAVTGVALASVESRRAYAAFMGSLATLKGEPCPVLPAGLPLLLAWGDDDRLVPASAAEGLRMRADNCVQVRIPGGRHLHQIERPWELADAVASWLERSEEPQQAV